MGRYSRKHMIEFAKFAKSYQSSRKVEEAYEAYLKGKRLTTKYNNVYRMFREANIVYFNNKTIKDRYNTPDIEGFIPLTFNSDYRVVSWNDDSKILIIESNL